MKTKKTKIKYINKRKQIQYFINHQNKEFCNVKASE